MNKIENLEKYLKIYEKLKNNIENLEKFKNLLEELEPFYKELTEYYQQNRLEDYDTYSNIDEYSDFFSEDGIWNVLTDFHQIKIEILKNIANKLN